jgi:threonine/homoserine/homoserine lactone efflux protein
MPDLLLPYLAVIAVLTITPGPDMVLVLRNGVRGGSEQAWATGLGCCAGIAIHATLAVLGLSAILAASSEAFNVVKLAGAAYLIYLGLQALSGAFRPRRLKPTFPDAHGRLAATAAYRQGVISNLGNPKMAAFFPSLLPQFAPGGDASFFALLALGLLFCAMTLVWLTAYALAVAKAGDLFRRPRIRRAIEGVTGAVLVALGIRLATSQR